MRNLDNMFRVLSDACTDDSMATIVIYDEDEGDTARFALGSDAIDDYSGEKWEALADRLSDAPTYADVQEVLESLPDNCYISVDNISIYE